MIIHGILADKDWAITMELLLQHPEVEPNSETKDCWMDRKAYSLYQKKRMQLIYKERWV